MCDSSILVCDDHVFKDDKLFYRFRKDDGTFEEPPDTAILAKGQRIYGRYIVHIQSCTCMYLFYGLCVGIVCSTLCNALYVQ